MTHRVLVVDDEVAVAKVLAAQLDQAGFAVSVAHSAGAALKALEQQYFGLVLTDVRMPGASGMELADIVYKRWPDIAVVMITAHGSIQLAVEAMKRGASDFLTKPFEREHVVSTVERALQVSEAHEPSRRRKSGQERVESEMLGSSAAMCALRAVVARISGHDASVLISGPTGSGKELVAKAIHDQSPRANKPWVALNCAALPEQLVESELFGHCKGAFTGATRDYPGRICLADGGTLFLDEVAELSSSVQAKLLRALAEQRVTPVGASTDRKVDVRIVSASHRDLRAMVEAGEFREDLYYRLVVLELQVPPLDDRKEDIGELARHFANQTDGPALDESAIEALRNRCWPGNVRELRNAVERLCILAEESTISAASVASILGKPQVRFSSEAEGSEDLRASREEAERCAIEDALEKTGGNRSQAARLLGISRRTLYNKLQLFGL